MSFSTLPEFEYEPLTSSNAWRILRLRPASDGSSDVDGELVEFKLSDDSHRPDDIVANGQLHKKGKEEEKAEKLKPKTAIGEDGRSGERTPKELNDKERKVDEKKEDENKNNEEEDDRKEENETGVDVKLCYEAVSWCWGREKQDQLLRLHKDDKVYAFYISKNLKTALWALRKNDEVRSLWIDAVCIDQKNTKERNEQVPKMDRIYGNAKSVCIWLGDADEDSKVAMNFIKNQVLSIWEFDKLIENSDMALQWHAFIKLMKRPWFSRRWVVQEIALSPSGGTLYCGKDEVPWSDFADAVSLFVEVESASHRLSDIMKLDKEYGHISEFFGDVSSLGAALLVEATSNLFRNSMTGKRQPLSTLEYLVSRLSVFEASQPRDTIYALLAISSDTKPQNVELDPAAPADDKGTKTLRKLAQKQRFASQPYNVDYTLPVVAVYKEFIEFAINKSEKTRALDIICRPWAPIVLKKHDKHSFLLDPSGATTENKNVKDKKYKSDRKTENSEKNNENDDDEEVPLPSWIPSVSGAAFEMEEHPTIGLRMARQNADPLVGLPGSDQRNYSAAETRALDLSKLKFVKWPEPGTHYPAYSMFVHGFVLDEVSAVYQIASNGNMPFQWLRPGGWTDVEQKPPDAFWKTLVADRGPRGRNPPTYFPRACRESMRYKAKTKSKTRGTLDSKQLINEGRCTIVAEFLRRVQAVIWNRLLMKTKSGRLGLVRDDVIPGYKICILYGCSVPVILKKIDKSKEVAEAEQEFLWKEWLQKRERAIIRIQIRWRLRKAKEEAANIKASQDKAAAYEKALSKLSSEELKESTLLRKPATWHPKTSDDGNIGQDQLANETVSGSKAASSTRKSSEVDNPRVDATMDMKGTSSDDAVASLRSSEVTAVSESGHKTGFPASFEEGDIYENDDIKKSQEPSEAIRGTGSKSQDAEDLVMSHSKGKEIGENEPEREKPRSKKWGEMSLPEKRAKGEQEAKKREADERKLAYTSSYYILYGECYVHGMMNGEAIALQNAMMGEGEMPQQIFELR